VRGSSGRARRIRAEPGTGLKIPGAARTSPDPTYRRCSDPNTVSRAVREAKGRSDRDLATDAAARASA